MFPRILVLLLSAWLAARRVCAETTIAILPAEIEMTGPRFEEGILVELKEGDHFTKDLTGEAEVSSSNPAVVRIENGIAKAVGNGSAEVRATHRGMRAAVAVKVSGLGSPQEYSFRNHVQPILARAGCSLGACHGAAAGQGGFRLSLRGYDDAGDYLTLTRGATGRRVTPADPARSLLLLKPTSAVAHKGGERFKVNSPEWQTIVEWIAAGMPAPKETDPRVRRLEVLPEAVRLSNGDKQQFRVRAHFSDGRVEDVTRAAKFTAVNQSVVNIDENGMARVIGNGESAISVWCLQQIAVGTVTAPFANSVASETFASAVRRNWIDEAVLEKLQSLNLPPSPRSTDAEFIRRAFIDTIGLLPTADETRAFVADHAEGKRDRLIGALLLRPEFVDYWSYKWSDLLLVTKRKLKPAAMWAYYQSIRDAVASNTPWDEFARQILTAQGSAVENGLANYFVMHPDPREAAETTALTFLGFSMNCARCHNHPLEKWTNDDYYGYANLFARVRMKNGGKDGDTIVFAAAEGELVQPLTGKPQAPRPLNGAEVLSGTSDRRAALADWLTSPQNTQFQKAIVNRVWANFFGVGLVENVDDIRASNPPSNEKLFALAADFLVQHRFDLKALMREILQSETYQRSSEPLPENKADTRFYSRYFPRRLMAETLHDAIAQVTTVPTQFSTKDPTVSGDKQLPFPLGWRALQLPDGNTDSYFTRAFGRPNREQTCECERTAEPSVTQALHVANGETINAKLQNKESCVAKALASGKSDEEMIEDAYLATVSRAPLPRERGQLLTALAAGGEKKREIMEDIYWALISSKEFLFNH